MYIWLYQEHSGSQYYTNTSIYINYFRCITCATDLVASLATPVRTQHCSSNGCWYAITGTWSTVPAPRATTMLTFWLVLELIYLNLMLLLNTAYLFTGQKDKPFVTDLENELRTPRPDLLDRPYAADYAGESYRNQYKVKDVFFKIWLRNN